MTIYRLYAENGNRADFWVQHRTWANLCAHVQSIAGQADGALPADEQVCDLVSMHVFDVRSGRRVKVEPQLNYRADRNYSRIAEPYWCHGIEKDRAHLQRTAR